MIEQIRQALQAGRYTVSIAKLCYWPGMFIRTIFF